MDTITKEFKSIADNIVDRFVYYKNDLFIGTPCGILSPIFSSIEKKKLNLIYAPREDSAIGVACGYSLKGEKSVVLMQNSGFAQSVNVLASLVEPFQIPITMIVSLRGKDIDTTRENTVMGEITENILQQLKIEYRFLNEENFSEVITWANNYIEREDRSVALLIEPNFLGWRP